MSDDEKTADTEETTETSETEDQSGSDDDTAGNGSTDDGDSGGSSSGDGESSGSSSGDSSSDDSESSDSSGGDSSGDGSADGAVQDVDERLEDDSRGTYELDAGEEGSEKESGTAGLPPKEEVDDSVLEEIESEREQRLDPDNRPGNVEIDNSPRNFDPDAGKFDDRDDYSEEEKPYAEGDDD